MIVVWRWEPNLATSISCINGLLSKKGKIKVGAKNHIQFSNVQEITSNKILTP